MQKTLRDAVRRAVEDADFKATMAKLDSPIAYLDAPDLAKYWRTDAERLARVVKVVGCEEDKK